MILRRLRRKLSSVAQELDEIRSSSSSSWSDLRSPAQLYPRARLRKRRIVYHGGPTNSGKTYWALEALKNARAEEGGGVYAGPLRLLAVEVYERLNQSGIYCSLFTGQERREVPFATHASCTIEMVPVGASFDVAVVDEIQMIGTFDRGHAWTRAVHGLDAREIHVCGALDAADLVARVCEDSGDDFELKTYERLTPLEVEPKPLVSWRDVRRGDCVVTFSRDDIHLVRRDIEKTNEGARCGVVYGQLPPETRSEQARLFNAGEYDVLVASDAIGMGLNLNIRRVIFRSTTKFSAGPTPDGCWERRRAPVEPTLVKQIAGRAGRMSSDFQAGAVTAMAPDDLAYVRKALATPQKPVVRAGLFPPAEILALFASTRPPEPLAATLQAFAAESKLDTDTYFLCAHHDMASASDKLVDSLDVPDLLVFCNAPCNLNDRFAVSMLKHFAQARKIRKPTGPNVRLPVKAPRHLNDLHDLCSKHNVLDTYLWLHYRFPDTFPEVDLARAQKARAIALIAAALYTNNLDLPEPKFPVDAPARATTTTAGIQAPEGDHPESARV
ncbi:hypothetical protein CTAYLR_008468 [Chrysophaeum taylorii]|uniref:RNA helicase n=1 Tax=Chrysophaeum taylorii TaxID=2483200 RepID=A0AAD7UHH1_9STRA|nr:hypothetical protein CTAYLR_008468 [Chrysophaeum taylorii]